jgi:hypothetical protein
MNAAALTKPASALILLSGLIAASTVSGAAQDAPIPLGAPATIALNSWYVAPPTGVATLGGHSFDLSGGNLLQLGNGQSASFSGSFANANAVYLLLNTSNTYAMWYDQAPVGTVVLTFSDGTTQSTTLTVGGNIREWRPNSIVTVNTVLPTGGSTQVWIGSAQPGMGGGTAVIDMLTIAAGGKTLTGVTLNDTNAFGALRIQLAGLTVDVTAPTPTCTKNDHDGKHSAEKAKNLQHCADNAKVDANDAEDTAEKDDAATA